MTVELGISNMSNVMTMGSCSQMTEGRCGIMYRTA